MITFFLGLCIVALLLLLFTAAIRIYFWWDYRRFTKREYTAFLERMRELRSRMDDHDLWKP